ncbi:transposase [Pseudarthrobacter sp. N5]|uniref:transposase n=1 Tax=Pseudarthrobacter sp. N5 TaxID=3418416 RepID=UPI003CFB02E6
MPDRKKYMQQFRDEAVELVSSSGRPIAQVCVDIRVNVGTLGNWVRKYRRIIRNGSPPARRRHPCPGRSSRRRWGRFPS